MKDTDKTYDYRDIARSGWISDLWRARPDSGFPDLDPARMTRSEVLVLASYLRYDDDTLSGADLRFSRRAADELEDLLEDP